jgi:type IV secretory pathway TrbD component
MSVAAWIVVGLLIWIVAMLVFVAFVHSATRLDNDD